MRDVAIHHPIFARLYPAMGKAMDRGGMADRRQALLTGLAGTVIEVGAGDGLNFAHYPATVTHVTAVEPEPHLRHRAQAAATQAPVPVKVVDGRAERLPAADTRGLARMQRILDATIWSHLAGGCHTGRDTIATVEQSGFRIERLDRFRFPDARTPSSFHVLGTAVPH